MATHKVTHIPAPFLIQQSKRDLTALSGLAFVGVALNRFAEIAHHIDPAFPVRQGLPSSQILTSYVGLLAEGKSDFEAIEAKREERFFRAALGLVAAPSATTLRQRMDALGAVDALLVPLGKPRSLREKAELCKLDIYPELSCPPEKTGGQVWIYQQPRERGHYPAWWLYFDSQGRLTDYVGTQGPPPK